MGYTNNSILAKPLPYWARSNVAGFFVSERKMKPQRVVCLDLGFAGNDQLKTNAVQILKNKEIVFKTA